MSTRKGWIAGSCRLAVELTRRGQPLSCAKSPNPDCTATRCTVNAPFILVVCLANLFCLAPLSVYLLYLAVLARRPRPTVVSGPWDFAALVAGLSGFVLFGGGLFLHLAQSNFRYWARGNLEAFRGAWASEKTTWLLLSLAYGLGVALAVVLTLAARRMSFSAYNVSAPEFEVAVGDALEQLNRPVERQGNVWSVPTGPLFRVDHFEGGRTATLRWLSDDRPLFLDVERLTREALRPAVADENPAGAWLMAFAGGAASWAAGSLGLLLVYFFSLK